MFALTTAHAASSDAMALAFRRAALAELHHPAAPALGLAAALAAIKAAALATLGQRTRG